MARMLLVAAAASGVNPVSASEGANYGGPVGGDDIQAAMLPPISGFYGAVVAGYAVGNRYYGNDGHQDPALHAKIASGVGAAGLLYVYPFKLLGGTLGTTLQGSVNGGRIEINGVSQTYSGVSDLYSDVLMWSKYFGNAQPGQPPVGLTLKLAYSMVFPVGEYNTTDLYTSGRNVWFFIPNVAFTYLTGPNALGDGLEVSAHVFLNFAAKNRATQYTSGTVADVNFAVSERWGRWQGGIAGYYASQLNDDYQQGQLVPPDGRRYASLAIGPVVSYDIPAWKSSVKFKALFPVHTKNSLAATTGYVVYSKAF
ncbi:transporter [Burkholderia sp. BCC0419]|uniref:SphA family protein n=1 Tax=Burkholderia sp. BCC0419 TaxID=486878 RepID=UPI00158CFAC6|nr:transporter [Burkholderia sp. BCC0419]